MAGGGGVGQAEACLQGGVEGVFKGIRIYGAYLIGGR